MLTHKWNSGKPTYCGRKIRIKQSTMWWMGWRIIPFLYCDWAMKFLQAKYHEKQTDWFGKRDLNWHIISSCIFKQDSENFDIVSYAHLTRVPNILVCRGVHPQKSAEQNRESSNNKSIPSFG